MAISAIGTQSLTETFKALTQKSTSSTLSDSSLSFTDIMNNAMKEVESLSNASETQANSLLTGETKDIHSVVIAAEKADIALQMTLQVRNKVLDAYQEMMRMQI